MSQPLQKLAQRIRSELGDLERLVGRIESGWQGAKRTNDDLYLDSVALNLHGFYSGLETLFELIATHVDKQKPTGANWHQFLLQQMTIEVVGIRPAVISIATYSELDEYRSFRHVVRNIYSFHFDPSKMEKLVIRVATLLTQLQAELLAFALFLEQQSN
jgi:hypothetical protein